MKYITIIAFLFCSCQQVFKGEIVSVHDGDSVTLLADGKIYKIRLADLDCPELQQFYGNQAKDFTTSLLLNKDVTAIKRDKDKYGRIVADIYCSGTWINKVIVMAGMAYVYPQYNNENLYPYELIAKNNKRGLWVYPNISPYQFRRNERRN